MLDTVSVYVTWINQEEDTMVIRNWEWRCNERTIWELVGKVAHELKTFRLGAAMHYPSGKWFAAFYFPGGETDWRKIGEFDSLDAAKDAVVAEAVALRDRQIRDADAR